MAHRERENDAGRQRCQRDQRYKQLEHCLLADKMDASNIDLGYDDARLVEHHLTQASERLGLATTEPDKQDEHIQVGFNHLGNVRRILGVLAVQSNSFRRYQWPFLLPGME